MIKKLLLGCFCWVFFLVFAAFPVKAQDKSSSLIVKGGFTYGKLNAEEVGVDEDYQAGVVAGVSLVKDIVPNFSLEYGLYYVMKKGKFSVDVGTYFVDFDVTIHYFEVPIGLRYDIPIQGQIKPNLYFGFYSSLKISDSCDISVQNISVGFDPDISSSDLGLSFGGGVEIANKYTIDVRYDYGLIDIDNYSDVSIKTRSFLFMLGYKFY